MSILERKDANFVVVVPWNDNDGGICYRIGFDGVTMIEIVRRHGPMDWIPYILVWQGDHLYAEIPQHQTLTIEFCQPAPENTDAFRSHVQWHDKHHIEDETNVAG